jgi:hypothetical protein
MLLSEATQEDMMAELQARRVREARENCVTWFELQSSGGGLAPRNRVRYHTYGDAWEAGVEAVAGWDEATFTIVEMHGLPVPVLDEPA